MQAIPGEEANMVLVPRWNEESEDTCIQRLVDTLLLATDGMDADTDLRAFTQVAAGALDPTLTGYPEILNGIVADPNEIEIGMEDDFHGGFESADAAVDAAAQGIGNAGIV